MRGAALGLLRRTAAGSSVGIRGADLERSPNSLELRRAKDRRDSHLRELRLGFPKATPSDIGRWGPAPREWPRRPSAGRFTVSDVLNPACCNVSAALVPFDFGVRSDSRDLRLLRGSDVILEAFEDGREREGRCDGWFQICRGGSAFVVHVRAIGCGRRSCKGRIVRESLAPGDRVADVAREYGLCARQLTEWRRAARLWPTIPPSSWRSSSMKPPLEARPPRRSRSSLAKSRRGWRGSCSVRSEWIA